MQRLFWIAAALGLSLAACAPAATPTSQPGDRAASPAPEQRTAVPTALPDGPLAPELTNEVWLNSPRLTPADLRGRVVLIDFWTFG